MRRIINEKKHINNIKENDEFYIAINATQDNLNIAYEIGLEEEVYNIPWSTGKRFLIENVQGKKHIDKNNKEAYFRDVHWVTTDYQGYIHEGIATYTAYRYHRYFDVPLELKLSIINNKYGDKIIVSEKLINSDLYSNKILLYINIFRELFGSFVVIDNDFDMSFKVNQLNWRILKPGESLVEYSNRIHAKQIVIKDKMKRNFNTFIDGKKVDAFVGVQSFQGYVAFVYNEYNFVVLESLIYDNATYVISKENWIEVTKLSKAEVLNSEYIVVRVIHNNEWNNNIKKLFDK